MVIRDNWKELSISAHCQWICPGSQDNFWRDWKLVIRANVGKIWRPQCLPRLLEHPGEGHSLLKSGHKKLPRNTGKVAKQLLPTLNRYSNCLTIKMFPVPYHTNHCTKYKIDKKEITPNCFCVWNLMMTVNVIPVLSPCYSSVMEFCSAVSR